MYLLYIFPLSSTHLPLRCFNFFNPSKKNSFGCAANRKIRKAKDLSEPLRIYAYIDTHRRTEQIDSSGNVSDLCLGGTRFECRPQHPPGPIELTLLVVSFSFSKHSGIVLLKCSWPYLSPLIIVLSGDAT
jgi:hypothetical protein